MSDKIKSQSGSPRRTGRTEGGPVDLEPDPRRPDPRLKKYRLAAYGFLGLNLVYLGIGWILLEQIPLERSGMWLPGALTLILLVFLTIWIHKGKRLLVRALAVVYGIRIGVAGAALILGKAFPGVQYLLPCLVGTFYLLGRAGWNWP